MKHVVSFSGGRTSAYMVYLMEKKRHQENLDVEYIFMDTAAEHPKTYEFIRNVVKHFGIKLTCIRAKISPVMGEGVRHEVISIDDIGPDLKPWKAMVAKYGTPYVNGAFCTSRLKTRPHDSYCNSTFGKNTFKVCHWEIWLGIRADEPKRLTERKNCHYLADISDFDKQDVLDFWANMPFDLDLEEWLGNCVFCIKKGLNKIALAIKDEPALKTEFADMLSSDQTRETDKGFPKQNIYRQYSSLDIIEVMYIDTTSEELISNLRGSKKMDSGSCTESCEVFGCQTDWVEEEENEKSK